jgi:hypothetical protein
MSTMHPNSLYVRTQRAKYKAQGRCFCGRERDDPKFKQCSTCRQNYLKYNPAKIAKLREWERAHPEEAKARRRRHNLSRNYGLTPQEFDQMLETQGGVCGICGGPPDDPRGFHVDHDHETDEVRGILCRTCNFALGCIADDIGRLDAMKAYLLKYQTRQREAS